MVQPASATPPLSGREERRKHIIALARTENSASLAELASIYRSETDPELRDLALHAGQFIRVKMAEAESGLKLMNTVGKKAGAAGKAGSEPSARERNARALVEEGLTLHLNGDNFKAMASLARALRVNPELASDPYFLGIATLATGREGADAVALLTDNDGRKEYERGVKAEQNRKRVDDHAEKAEQERWLAVGIDVLLYAIIVVVGPIVALLIFSESLKAYLAGLAATEAGRTALALAKLPEPITFGLALKVGLIVGVTNIVGLLAQNLVVHVVATRMVGGRGTLRHLLANVIGLYNRKLPVLFVLAYAIIWLTFMMGTPVILTCGTIFLLLFYLYTSLQASKRISQAYAFSRGSGFVSVLLGDLVLTLINVGMVLLISPLLAPSLSFKLPGS